MVTLKILFELAFFWINKISVLFIKKMAPRLLHYVISTITTPAAMVDNVLKLFSFGATQAFSIPKLCQDSSIKTVSKNFEL